MTSGKVMGLDLSLTSTGLAVADSGQITWTGNIKTTGKKGDDLVLRDSRLAYILNQVAIELFTHQPELVVIEAPSYGSTMGSQHDRSGLWWVVARLVFRSRIPVATVSPNGRAKYGTGKGNAKKDVVHDAVIKRYADVEIKGNDQADAVILAAMGSRHLGYPIEPELPEANLLAMDGAYWPSGLVST